MDQSPSAITVTVGGNRWRNLKAAALTVHTVVSGTPILTFQSTFYLMLHSIDRPIAIPSLWMTTFYLILHPEERSIPSNEHFLLNVAPSRETTPFELPLLIKCCILKTDQSLWMTTCYWMLHPEETNPFEWPLSI